MRDYRRTEARQRAREDGNPTADAAADAERADRMAGTVRIERGPAAFRVTFPKLTAAERGTPESKAAWEQARRPMADVKAIMGRRYDATQAAWIVPADQAAAVECLALDYGATIEPMAADVPAEAAARIAELEAALAAALRLADEYAAMLDAREAVAA